MFWHKVLATHEEKQITSLGPWPGDDFLGVALPSRDALRRMVIVRYEGKEVEAMVADVGPWMTDDDAYVFGEERPRAEILKGKASAITKDGGQRPSVPDGHGGFKEVSISNGAGIDIFPGTARALGIAIDDNVELEWRFV